MIGSLTQQAARTSRADSGRTRVRYTAGSLHVVQPVFESRFLAPNDGTIHLS